MNAIEVAMLVLQGIIVSLLAVGLERLCPRLPRFTERYLQAALLLVAALPWLPVPVSPIADLPILHATAVAVSQSQGAWSLPVPAFVLSWAAGTVALLLYTAFGLLRLESLIRKAVPLPDGHPSRSWIAAAPGARLLLSPSTPGAFTCGLLRPVIVLPERFLELTLDQQQAIVSHEMWHIRRRDYASVLLERLICACLWFQPGAWILQRQIRLAREQAVDIYRQLWLLSGSIYLYPAQD